MPLLAAGRTAGHAADRYNAYRRTVPTANEAPRDKLPGGRRSGTERRDSTGSLCIVGRSFHGSLVFDPALDPRNRRTCSHVHAAWVIRPAKVAACLDVRLPPIAGRTNAELWRVQCCCRLAIGVHGVSFVTGILGGFIALVVGLRSLPSTGPRIARSSRIVRGHLHDGRVKPPFKVVNREWNHQLRQPPRSCLASAEWCHQRGWVQGAALPWTSSKRIAGLIGPA